MFYVSDRQNSDAHSPKVNMTLVHINFVFEAVLVKVYFSGDLIGREEFMQR